MQTAHAIELRLRVGAPRADRMARTEPDGSSSRISVGLVVLLIAVVAAVVLTVTVPAEVAESSVTSSDSVSGTTLSVRVTIVKVPLDVPAAIVSVVGFGAV